MNIFLTSDLHFSHERVIEYSRRPFKDVNHMNESIIANWNAVVAPDDLVYIIGDFSLSWDPVENITRRLNGRKILVPGNHDRPHRTHKGKTVKKLNEWCQKYVDQGFELVEEQMEVEFHGERFLLCHLPYEDFEDTHRNDPTKYRYETERPIDFGLPQLCGHRHEKWLVKMSPSGQPMINVGIDAPEAPWTGQYRPATLEEVMTVYRKAKGKI